MARTGGQDILIAAAEVQGWVQKPLEGLSRGLVLRLGHGQVRPEARGGDRGGSPVVSMEQEAGEVERHIGGADSLLGVGLNREVFPDTVILGPVSEDGVLVECQLGSLKSEGVRDLGDHS